jgi:hypothetical protein
MGLARRCDVHDVALEGKHGEDSGLSPREEALAVRGSRRSVAIWYAMMTTLPPGTDAPAHTGVLHTLDSSGDTRIMWDKGNPDEVASARRTFDELLKKGYAAFRAVGKHGDQGEQIRRFDPEAERIILVRALQGG